MQINIFSGGSGRDRHHRHHRDDHEHGGVFNGVRIFHGPMRFRFFGRPVIVTTGKQIGFTFCFVAILVLIVSTFAVFGNLKTAKADKKYYQTEYNQFVEDYSKYVDVIQNAEKGTENYYSYNGTYDPTNKNGSVKNEVAGVIEDKYSNNYYVVFLFKHGTDWYYGKTLESYSKSSVSNNYSIEIAYKVENGEVVLVVEKAFKNVYNTYLAEYEEYLQSAKDSYKTALTAAIILIAIIAVIVAVIVLLIVKVVQKSKKEQALEYAKKEAEIKEAEARADEAEARAIQAEEQLNLQRRYCEYCGAKFPDGENKCPNCGSTHFVIKK